MAQYYARIHGSRGPASRLGDKQSGMRVSIKSWEGQLDVRMFRREHKGEAVDWVVVEMGPHSSAPDAGRFRFPIYDGPCSAWRERQKQNELTRMLWNMDHGMEIAA